MVDIETYICPTCALLFLLAFNSGFSWSCLM